MTQLDLHIHSRHSLDGEYAPEQLVAMAKAAGVGTIAITDHNATGGVAAAAEACVRAGIDLIPGIEIDCTYEGVDLHVLGYFIDYADTAYAALSQELMGKELAASAARVDRVRALGLHIDQEQVDSRAPGGVATPEFLAGLALEDAANADCALLDPYRPGGDRSDNAPVNFYWDYCSQGKPAFSAIQYMSLADAVSLVRRTGGVPVLAHPGINLKNHPHLLPGILAEGVQGIEVYCSSHTPEKAAFWRECARRHNVAITSGSDYHGKTKPSVKLGVHGGAGCEKEILDSLRALRR